MTQEPPRPPTLSVVQGGTQVASDVVGALKTSPALLAVVVLNLVAVVAAVWFLRELAESNKELRNQLLTMIAHCMDGDEGPR